jgi:hypothetical protein
MLRRTLQLLCAAMVGLGTLAVAWVAAQLDDPPCDCSRRASRPVVPDEQNGMHLLEGASTELWWPAELSPRLEALRKGETLDPALEREVLGRNAAVLAAVPAALAAPSFVVPDIDPEPGVVHFARGSAWQTVSRLLSLRALHHARQGERERALSDALAAARLGARIESGHGASLLEASFATSMKTIGLGALGRVLAAFELDAGRSRALAEEISALHVSSEAWRRVWEFEYETQLRVIRSMEETSVSTEALLGLEDEPLFRAPELLLRLVPRRYLFKPTPRGRCTPRRSSSSAREGMASAPERAGPSVHPKAPGVPGRSWDRTAWVGSPRGSRSPSSRTLRFVAASRRAASRRRERGSHCAPIRSSTGASPSGSRSSLPPIWPAFRSTSTTARRSATTRTDACSGRSASTSAMRAA